MKRMWISLLLIAVTGAATAQDRPNVVVMLADNVGYGDIGAYGAGEVRGMPTPRIDQLASEGLRLTQYLVEPGCTPSRAALMTGRYSQRAGLSTIIVGGTPNTLQASEVTLGELFKGRGYATGIVGKWHLGASEQSWPTRQGFDEYRVGVIETTDGTLYRDGIQRAGMPEAAIAAAEPYIWESEADGKLKKVRPYTVEYRRQSVTVWFGPNAPAGQKGNWVQTVPGKGWNTILRLYGPLQAWFDQSWKPGDFELVM